jgi:hypothetical protein
MVSATARDVHLMVRGDLNPFLRRVAELDVHDLSITTPDIEDIFLRFYDREAPLRADEAGADAPREVAR